MQRKILSILLSVVLILGMCGAILKTEAMASLQDTPEEPGIEVLDEMESVKYELEQESQAIIEDKQAETSESKNAEETMELQEDSDPTPDQDPEDGQYYEDGIRLKKTWHCEAEQIPSSVTFILKMDGVEISYPLTLKKSDFEKVTVWEGKFEALEEKGFPKGENYNYTVEEKYDTSSGIEFVQSKESGLDLEEEGRYSLINEIKPAEEIYEAIYVDKTFDCRSAGEPVDATFTLKVDGKDYSTLVIHKEEFTEVNNGRWLAHAAIKPLGDDQFLKSSAYELVEKEIENCRCLLPLFHKNEGRFEVTNLCTSPPDHGRFKIVKIWRGGVPLNSVTFTLLMDGKAIDTLTMKNPKPGSIPTEDVTWTGYFRGKEYPLGHTYTLEESVNGKDITYYDYEASGLTEYDGNMGGFTVINTYQKEEVYNNISVTKKWVGGEPLPYVNFTLYQDGKAIQELKMKNPNKGTDTASVASVGQKEDEVASSAILEWNAAFKGKFEKNHTYTLTESFEGKDISNYDYEASGLNSMDGSTGAFFVTNTYDKPDDPPKDTGTLRIMKYWIGNSEDSFTITLYRDEACTKKYKTYTITADDCDRVNGPFWWYDITDLPYDTDFWVLEKPINGYTVEYDDLIAFDGWSIKNRYDGKSTYNNTTNNDIKTNSAATGDDHSPGLYVLLIILSIVGVGCAIKLKKHSL